MGFVVAPGRSNTGLKTYIHAYNSILAARRRSPSTSASSVIVLVSPEVDALCASRILVHLFTQDDVMYRIIPIIGYPGLQRIRDELLTYTELHTLILLNIGSMLDLPSSDWFGDFPPRVTVHVIDSARPQNLSSLFGQGPTAHRIIVWDDGSVDGLTEERKAFALISTEQEPTPDLEYGAEAADVEHEGGMDDPDEETTSHKRKAAYHYGASSDDEPDDVDEPPRQRRRLDFDDRSLSPEDRDDLHATIDAYYSLGTFHGQSTAVVLYMLSTTLERAEEDTLWLAILALTHQYISGRLSRERYEELQAYFHDEVARLNPASAESAISAPHADDCGIRPSEEFRFTLFRHWNLYDSMYHSSYVASKLGIWKEKGKKRLQGLFAKMGFSLQQCQQAYAHMDMDLKKTLRERLESIAPEYGLIELSYPSFVRYFGFRSQPLSAADVVDGIGALLEAATGLRLEVDIEGSRGGGEWFGGSRSWNLGTYAAEENAGVHPDATDKTLAVVGEANAGDTAAASSKAESEWWIRNFWVAYDALGTNITLLRDSLPLSMALQRAIIRQGSTLIEKQAIRTFQTFQLSIVKEGPDLTLFGHPATLSRLALWIADALRDQGAMGSHLLRQKSLPYVVACLLEKAGNYLVVGINTALEFGDIRRNQFGLAFFAARDQSHAQTEMGTFETNIVEVDKEDLTAFLESLQLHL